MEFRWLTRYWEEMHEEGIKQMSERVLQFKGKTHELWHDVPEVHQKREGLEG